MALDADLKTFDRLAAEIGGAPALMLTAFCGVARRPLYIPAVIADDHLLVRLLGREPATWLAQAYGGESISIPNLDALEHVKAAGLVAALSKHGVGANLMAAACDLSTRRIEQLRSQLAREGFGELLATAEDGAES